jgi:hypothetical protein
MRTTLTLDDDVAAKLKSACREREVPFKQVVNEALRRGLDQMARPAPKRERFRIEPWNLGECSLPNLDSIEEVLDYAEGDWRR